jgi:hypothetical protein
MWVGFAVREPPVRLQTADIDFLGSAALQVRESEAWIARPARLHQLGFADADARVSRL